jgi:hypothetical protein
MPSQPQSPSQTVAARRIGWISQHGKYLLHERRAAMFEAGCSGECIFAHKVSSCLLFRLGKRHCASHIEPISAYFLTGKYAEDFIF